MSAFGQSRLVAGINVFLTIGLIFAIALVAALDPGIASKKPKWLAGAVAVYALYLSCSSLVTGKILARLVFVSRAENPIQFLGVFCHLSHRRGACRLVRDPGVIEVTMSGQGLAAPC